MTQGEEWGIASAFGGARKQLFPADDNYEPVTQMGADRIPVHRTAAAATAGGRPRIFHRSFYR